jgi:hypothetical protein
MTLGLSEPLGDELTNTRRYTMTLIRLTSDNFTEQLMTPEAYELIALTMSSGDHGSHLAEVLIMPKEHAQEHGYMIKCINEQGETCIALVDNQTDEYGNVCDDSYWDDCY